MVAPQANMERKKRKGPRKRARKLNLREEEANARHRLLLPVLHRAWRVFFSDTQEEIATCGLEHAPSRWLSNAASLGKGTTSINTGAPTGPSRNTVATESSCLSPQREGSGHAAVGTGLGPLAPEDANGFRKRRKLSDGASECRGRGEGNAAGSGSEAPQTCRQAKGREGGTVSIDSAETGVNWMALEAMKTLLKPKLWTSVNGTLEAKETSCRGTSSDPRTAPNLFNTIHEVKDNDDVKSVAHDTHVILPARSRFLMSDFKHVTEILAGKGQHALTALVPDNASAM